MKTRNMLKCQRCGHEAAHPSSYFLDTVRCGKCGEIVFEIDENKFKKASENL